MDLRYVEGIGMLCAFCGVRFGSLLIFPDKDSKNARIDITRMLVDYKTLTVCEPCLQKIGYQSGDQEVPIDKLGHISGDELR